MAGLNMMSYSVSEEHERSDFVNNEQTDIFDFLNEEEDKKINCTIRISKPIGLQKYERKVVHFESQVEKERYLSKLDIAIHRKSKYIHDYEIIVLNYDWSE